MDIALFGFAATAFSILASFTAKKAPSSPAAAASRATTNTSTVESSSVSGGAGAMPIAPASAPSGSYRVTSQLDFLRESIQQDGLSNVMIVMDFDRTISTNIGPNGQRGKSCHGVAHGVLSPENFDQVQKLDEKYGTIERDPLISTDVKAPEMIRWTELTNEILVKSGMTRDRLKEACKTANISMRAGVREVFDFAASHDIPFIIFSAGLGDVIELFLSQKYQAPLPRNFRIVSNFFVWGEDGKVAAMQPPLIHSNNKTAERWCKAAGVEIRPNCIVVGDSLGDAFMAHGLKPPPRSVLRVGLVNENTEANLPRYSKAFDCVLSEDPPMDYVMKLLQSCRP